jgi:cytochrome c oxidase cbb3-type subunit 3
MCAKPIKEDPKPPVGTTGHSWDGIEELNNPLPRWWVWSFYLCIAFALVYSVLYPAWPLIHGATPGLLGASTRADVAADIKRFDDLNAPIKAKLVAADLTAIEQDDSLKSYAMEAGKSIFATNCAPCHGAGAAGVQGLGYPNLLDNDWLYGGGIAAIHATITHGVRNTVDPDARNVGIYMPAWSAKVSGPLADVATAKLTDVELAQVVNYVLKVSGQAADEAKASAGRYGCAQPDRCDLALRWQRSHADRHHRQRTRRRHAKLGLRSTRQHAAPDRRPDPRRGRLCPQSWRRRVTGPE